MRGVRAAWALLRSPAFAPLVRPAYYWREAIIGNDDLLRRAVIRLASACWHATGTARMGAASDGGAVVDEQGRVHGLSGLRIADASIIAEIPSAPTNLSCLMLAERIAQWMR
jgi:choline dehydrogenase